MAARGTSAAAGACLVSVEPVAAESPSADEILARARAVYSSCSSFRDRCSCTAVMIRDSGERDTKLSSFTLDFVRPDRFRLESVEHGVGPEDEWPRTLNLMNEGGARSGRSGDKQLRRWERAEIPSWLKLHCVTPGLLVAPTRPEWDPLPGPRVHLLGMSTHEDRECFLVAGKVETGFQRTLWIDRERYLVRRCDDIEVFDEARRAHLRADIERQLRWLPSGEVAARRHLESILRNPLETFRSEVTWLFEPELDPAIPEERFATPDDWRGLPITDLPERGAPPDPPAR